MQLWSVLRGEDLGVVVLFLLEGGSLRQQATCQATTWGRSTKPSFEQPGVTGLIMNVDGQKLCSSVPQSLEVAM